MWSSAIERNIYFTFFIIFINYGQSKHINHRDICSDFDEKRVYVELGTNNTIIGQTNENENIEFNETADKPESFKQCRLELITCSGCILSVKLTFLNLSEDCKSCECDYLWIYESPYNLNSKQKICGNYENESSSVYYRSRTKAVIIRFFYNQTNAHSFSLQYESKRNVEVYHGSCTENNNNTQSIITPYFPYLYPKDLNIEYSINCENYANCKIRLIFTDFLIAKVSIIEVVDWNGKRLTVFTGFTFRPPILISSGPSLTLRFYGNGANGKGFKATYDFLPLNELPKYQTSCGGLVNDLGGGITMMNMVKDEGPQSFDCIWIIQPSRNYLHFYTNLLIRVVAFADFDGNAQLTVHDGLTSVDLLKENLQYPNISIIDQNHKAYVTSISKGFYIRFRGMFRDSSRLAIAYSAFSYFECTQGSEFLCANKRCIPVFLQCDGFDHCGDNTDEPSTCFQELKDRRWFHTLNFFFPKTDQYFDLHAMAIIFVVCCFVLGLISLIFALTILIFRLNKRHGSHNGNDEHFQVITELLEQDMLSIQEELIEDEDEPPVYEEPPNYDDASKNKVENSSSFKGYQNFSVKRHNNCQRCKDPRKTQSLRGVRPRNTNLVQASTSTVIPESPPPTYSNISLASNANSIGSPDATTSNDTTNSKNTFFKDFALLKLKLFEKFKTNQDNNYVGLKEIKNHPWMSDSNILELDYVVKEDLHKKASKPLKRSISFQL